MLNFVRKVASPHVQVASQPHESRKLNLVVPEKSCDFSYAIRKGGLAVLVTLKLRSKKRNEINKFLSSFYNTNMEISEKMIWTKEYQNPVEVSEIIGVYIDNIDSYDFRMWLCLDKNIYIHITESNGNEVIKYLFERFPY